MRKMLLVRSVLTAALVIAIASACTSSDDSSEGSPRSGDASPAAESGGDGDGSSDDAEPSTPAQPPLSVLFSEAVRRVTLEVDYVPGAEPYTGSTGRLGSIWEIYQDNVTALFDGKKELVYPSTLAEMERIEDVGETQFRTADILTIAQRHRAVPPTSDAVTFYVIFLRGVYVEPDGNASPETLGVSIGSTGVIAMFKPAIASTATKGTTTPRFVEQATLVHELGHAVGLVDNGVTATSAHLDPDHANHCSSASCVMYWSNEGARGAADYVQNYLETGSRVLFGPECLADLRAFELGLKAE
jgi:hypothetical protein